MRRVCDLLKKWCNISLKNRATGHEPYQTLKLRIQWGAMTNAMCAVAIKNDRISRVQGSELAPP